MAEHLERRRDLGLPPPVCTDHPVGLLTGAGWEAVEIVEPGQTRASFGRP